MPIYLGSQAVKPYRGSTEIAEAYLGSTLVYQNTRLLYPASGVTVANLQANTGSYSLSEFMTQTTSGENRNGTTLYIEADLTDINSLQVDGEFSATKVNGYAGCWIASASQWLGYPNNEKYGYYTIGPGASSTYYVRMQRQNNSVGSTSSFTFDVSALNGTHYICINVYSNNSSGGSVKAKIDTITVLS